jgi:leucyl-tRNA synthetase
MSKSKGNVVDPLDLFASHGADALRLYHLFIGPPTDDAAWNTNGVDGTRRFLDRVWKLASEAPQFADREESEADRDMLGVAHRTVKKVTEDIDAFRFNTAIPALMIMVNELGEYVRSNPRRVVYNESIRLLLLMLATMAPHVAHELWEMRGGTMLALEAWPDWDEDLAREETVTLIVQVNGKVRDRVEVSADIGADEAEEVALGLEKIQGWIEGKEVKNVISRPPNLVNVVVG